MRNVFILATAVLMLVAGSAHAQANGATLSCAAPTQNTDGSTITAAQKPLTFKFYEGTVSGTYPNSSAPQTACALVMTGLAAGVHFFTVTTIDKLGGVSAMAAPVSKPVVNPTPNAPSMLTVGPDLTAYQIVQSPDGLELLAFGRVAPNTPCNTGRSVNGMYLVPWQSVTMPNGQPNTTRKTVLAACG